jgi:succinate-semialdehyde dehydrogenase/glutarate-semialdehyde dehydrogenase
MTAFTSINPYTGETLKQFDFDTDLIVEKALTDAVKAQTLWQKSNFNERAKPVLHLIELITSHADELALMASIEMGKPITEAKLEVAKCTTACQYYATNAHTILATTSKEEPSGDHIKLLYEPMGVILGIFPWNFPYWQIIRSAIPILMGGNAMLVKPAPNVPQCSKLLQHLFDCSGFPSGLIQTLFVDTVMVSKIIAHKHIAACTLTGSEVAGAAVAGEAGKHIKKTVLELGGSDPFIITENADLQLVLKWAITARFQNNGQSCIAAKRFIIHQSVYDEFLNQLIPKIEGLICGDPLSENTQIGPLARPDLREKLAQQVNESIKMGAHVLFKHPYTTINNCFYPPTVLGNIPKESPAYCEELFGPVLSVYKYINDEEAIAIANDTPYGLGGSVWSNNILQATEIAHALSCGQVNINSMVKSAAAYPFGGYKKSGIGKELGEWGIKEFCNVKIIKW